MSVFTSISLSTNYALAPIPNVKVMDALVFIAAFLFGLDIGLGVAVFTWSVYGYVNPWGQAGLGLLGFLIIGECFYAIAGTIVRRASLTRDASSEPDRFWRWTKEGLVFGVAGVISTFGYDMLTNFASYVFTTTSLFNALVIGMATGATFAVVHEVSNLVLFATVAPATIASARPLLIRTR